MNAPFLVAEPEHRFGGSWTQEKLRAIEKYLRAYATIMASAKQKGRFGTGFAYAYIDAFAGTGSIATHESSSLPNLFDDGSLSETSGFLKGSARIALEVEPGFDKYIFIEQSQQRCRELEALKTDFPEKAATIKIQHGDANSQLQKLCSRPWQGKPPRRAVLFLDPYGMEVEWQTIEAIAKTQAIDVWILLPVGVAINRFLRKDGNISEVDKQRLTRIFGTEEWYDRFYKVQESQGLLGPQRSVVKEATFQTIGDFYLERLETVFPGRVAKSAKPLLNSKGNPLFYLCFASGNPKGAKTALKIAEHLLKA